MLGGGLNLSALHAPLLFIRSYIKPQQPVPYDKSQRLKFLHQTTVTCTNIGNNEFNNKLFELFLPDMLEKC